jgi:hypothetical protein
MSQDLEEYHDIIEALKPMINEPEFNQVLLQVAANVPPQKRFLLKMELKRLARPCIRLIDLRGLVDGKCRIYTHEGRDHFLDDIAIETLERQVRIFGQYTIGVYEAVTNTENNFRVMHKKEQQLAKKKKAQATPQPIKKEFYLAPLIEFGNIPQRAEERMNFSVNIEIFNELNKSMQATTIDISVNGLKVKVGKEHLVKAGDKLTVQFRGLEKEYALDKRQGIIYTVGSIERTRDDQRLNLQRLQDMPNPSFDKFFESFIHGNKRRYKVNLDNTFQAIQNKTYEQYYIPNFTSIPVFIEKTDNGFSPKYALANDCNREEIQYWANEIQDLKIGYLLSDSRIKHCISLPKGQQETYIYVFNHVKGDKIYFYSATIQELDASPHLKHLFLAYASRKASWRVYKLQITDILPEQSYQPLSIANTVNESVKRQNQKPAPRLMSRLKNLSHVALLTNITDETSTEYYQRLKISRDQLPQLKMFGHPRNRLPDIVTVYRFKYFNQRRETRFLLRTPITVNVDGHIYQGNTEDISTQGLRIELDKSFTSQENSLIKISFPNLQKVTVKYVLADLPYFVRHISKDNSVLHLQALVNEHNNTAKHFFDALIKANRTKLRAYRDEEEVPGIGEALRNIYSRNVMNVAYFLRKDDIDFVPDAVATWAPNNRLTNLLHYKTEAGNFNLYPLYRNTMSKHDFIPSAMHNLKPNERPVMREVFIAFDPSKDNLSDAIKSLVSEQFIKHEKRRQFISQAMQNGQFIALKVFIAKTGRPDIEKMQSELNYVGVYALHKAKQLEEKLWSVTGVGDLIDVTDEVMRRYEFTEEKIAENQKFPATHKIQKVGIEQLLKS